MKPYYHTGPDRVVSITERALKPTKLELFRQFVGPAQRRALYDMTHGEEGAFFRQKIAEILHLIEIMPTTYQQDGLGDQALVYLHYFTSGADWYITEKDAETPDAPGQHQAFGLSDLFGDGGELGYISLVEVLAAGAELDLYWTLKTMDAVRNPSKEA